jgi:chitodextrinase
MLVASHNVTLSNLIDDTTYHYRVKTADSSGNMTVGMDSIFSTLDGTPPVISNVVITNVTPNGATITWTTDEPADGQVEWGLTTGYGSESMLVSTLDTTHSITLTGLTENTAYHFRIKSKDSAGNLETGTDATFTSGAGRKRGGQLTSQD